VKCPYQYLSRYVETPRELAELAEVFVALTKAGYLETSSRPSGVELIPSKSLPIPTLAEE
jgi:hypothetical protein